VQVSGFGGLITFRDVADSRCPEGVQCVWAGEAAATVDFWGSDYLGAAEIWASPATPNSASKMDAATSTYYSVRCISTDPYPVFDVAVPKTSYSITIVIGIAIP
jgi:hypothetical protein